jgi:hypothetical protein
LWVVRQRQVLLGPVTQEEDLKVDGPLAHVGVKVSEVRVVRDRFVGSMPSQSGSKSLREGCFSGRDIAGDEDKVFGHVMLLEPAWCALL